MAPLPLGGSPCVNHELSWLLGSDFLNLAVQLRQDINAFQHACGSRSFRSLIVFPRLLAAPISRAPPSVFFLQSSPDGKVQPSKEIDRAGMTKAGTFPPRYLASESQ